MNERRSVGVIGTGQIGSRMALRLLQAGYRVVVHDLDEAAMQGMPGAEQVESAAAVAAQCDLIITCVTDNHAVRDVVLGAGGIIESIRPAHLVIETTTSTPATTREVTAVLRRNRADLVDAPVSRGVPAAESGTLSIMVGGEDSSRRHALPVLSVLGTDIIDTGDVGTGHVAKAMNMMVMAVNFIATMELMHVAESRGISRDDSISAFAAGPGRSFVLDRHWPRYILPETYDSGFTLGLMHKDLRIAGEIAADSGQYPLLGERATAVYRWAVASGMAEADNTCMVQFMHHARAGLGGDAVPEESRDVLLRKLGRALYAAVYLGTLEALVVARAAGLEPDRLLAVLNASSGGSRMAGGNRDGVPGMAALHRDARSATLIATEEGDPHFITGLAAYLLGLACRDLPDDAHDDRVVAWMARLTRQPGRGA